MKARNLPSPFLRGQPLGMSSPLYSLIESTSVVRRQFKITGQIGDPDQKDKLNYSSLRKQMETGVEQKYK